MELEEIVKISKDVTGFAPSEAEKLSSGGSPRKYTRLFYNQGDIASVILCEGDDFVENRCFCRLAEAFSDYAHTHALEFEGILFPEILWHSHDFSVYLQTDLGPTSLMDIILSSKKSAGHIEANLSDLVRNVLDALIKVQTVPTEVWEDKVFNKPFGLRMSHWDLNYFKYEFLKPAGIAFDEDLLQDDLDRFASALVSVDAKYQGFMYRDFQSRNIMISPSGIGLIDFQGGRRGVMVYDAISLLWQAKADFSRQFREESMDYYIRKLCGRIGGDEEELWRITREFVLFRTLQVLGAYGFRGLVEGKAHFIESIPGALRNLQGCIAEGTIDDYPELKRCCESLCRDNRWGRTKEEGLTVEIVSFSYKKGYPANYTGNGGGFMFDCRGMHNPGRYDEYKTLTGMDKPVIDFLEERGEVFEFVDNALRIISPVIDTYRRRGFSDLQIGFGCTGGQHRSVYCAERTAREIAERYPSVQVRLIHREQGVDRLV